MEVSKEFIQSMNNCLEGSAIRRKSWAEGQFIKKDSECFLDEKGDLYTIEDPRLYAKTDWITIIEKKN